MKTFNSTRYIRNRRPLRNFPTGTQLSTPHGTLGTATPSSASSGFLCFQLHTVHQERSIYKPVRSYQKNFQLHTVHQEQRHKRISLSPLFTFNSTRYIRNISPEERLREKLKKSFNSTRYIRNSYGQTSCKPHKNFQLHTVHQELMLNGCMEMSLLIFQLHTVHQEPLKRDSKGREVCCFQLHTVHQELRC